MSGNSECNFQHQLLSARLNSDQQEKTIPSYWFNPYLTNEFSLQYHLGESTFLGASGVILKLYSNLRWNFSKQTEKPQMGRHVLLRRIWGYAVCLCPTKGTPGLNELNHYADRGLQDKNAVLVGKNPIKTNCRFSTK